MLSADIGNVNSSTCCMKRANVQRLESLRFDVSPCTMRDLKGFKTMAFSPEI